MAKPRAKRRSFIRRKRVTPQKQTSSPAPVEAKKAAVKEQASEGGDWGFVSGYRAGDFESGELAGDFVSDNEVQVSDETFEAFEAVFGTNEQLLGQGKQVADSLGKAIGMIGSL